VKLAYRVYKQISYHSEEIFKIQNNNKNWNNYEFKKECLLSATIQGFKYPSNSIPIYILNTFVTKNKDQFLANSQVHKINTRQTSDLYVPTSNLAIYQKGAYYSEINTLVTRYLKCLYAYKRKSESPVLNVLRYHLPTAIKDLSGDNKFKLVLEKSLLHNSFYSLEEYFST
jgi:hypothetical protein